MISSAMNMRNRLQSRLSHESMPPGRCVRAPCQSRADARKPESPSVVAATKAGPAFVCQGACRLAAAALLLEFE